MLFLVRTAALFLIRSRRTSGVLAMMVVIAVASLIFLSSLAVGVNDAMVRNSAGLYSGHISGYNIPCNIRKDDLLLKTGVANVLKRAQVSGYISFKGKVEKIILIGIDPDQERESSGFWKKVVKGRFINRDSREIFLSGSLAAGLGAGCGDTLLFDLKTGHGKRQYKVSGVYKTGITRFDSAIAFCDIGTVVNKTEYDSGKKTSCFWDGAVFLKDGADMDAVVKTLNNKFSASIDFKTWKQLMPDLEQLILLNYFSMGIVIMIVFIIVSLGLTSAFSIFILKSMREYGIMKVMGMDSTQTISLLCLEVFLINIAASFFGIIFGIVIVSLVRKTGIDISAWTSHNQYFVVSGVIFPRLTSYSLWLPPFSALVFSIPSAIWPGIMVLKKSAAEILRGI